MTRIRCKWFVRAKIVLFHDAVSVDLERYSSQRILPTGMLYVILGKKMRCTALAEIWFSI